MKSTTSSGICIPPPCTDEFLQVARTEPLDDERPCGGACRVVRRSGGGGGNRTRVRRCGTRASPGAACCGLSQPQRSRKQVAAGLSHERYVRGPRDLVREQWLPS